MSVTHVHADAKIISPGYSDAVLLDREHKNPRSNDASFDSMCDFPDKNIKFTKVAVCFKLLQ